MAERSAVESPQTPECRTLSDCPRPGPTNELLAGTANAFVRSRSMEHGQRVHVIAQWEVAAALRRLAPSGAANATAAVGNPGVFENTAQIFEQMYTAMAPDALDACDVERAADAPPAARVVLLAHPDHLRRALRIGQTTFAAHAPPAAKPCPPPRLMPALQPYSLDWSSASAAPGARLNLYAGVSGLVHTRDEVHAAEWYEAPHGYYPDGDPQRWAHRHEIWVCYEIWARAKGVATGVIGT